MLTTMYSMYSMCSHVLRLPLCLPQAPSTPASSCIPPPPLPPARPSIGTSAPPSLTPNFLRSTVRLTSEDESPVGRTAPMLTLDLCPTAAAGDKLAAFAKRVKGELYDLICSPPRPPTQGTLAPSFGRRRLPRPTRLARHTLRGNPKRRCYCPSPYQRKSHTGNVCTSLYTVNDHAPKLVTFDLTLITCRDSTYGKKSDCSKHSTCRTLFCVIICIKYLSN